MKLPQARILLGHMVNYKNKASADYKHLNFFVKAIGFSQLITTTTRNTDKSKTLIDLILTNAKYISSSGTLEHYISDHQPVYVVKKKGRDRRPKVEFEGRSYKDFDQSVFREELQSGDWKSFFNIEYPESAWDYLLHRLLPVLDRMCPVRKFMIKNYRPDWMTNELIELAKDRDYFYCKAKRDGDEDAWNIAKHLRNIVNAGVRQSKREFILDQLNDSSGNYKKFWKVIREVVPTGGKDTRREILLRNEGCKLEKKEVAKFINEYFINIGNSNLTPLASPYDTSLEYQADMDTGVTLEPILVAEVLKLIKTVNVSKSSGLSNISSFIVKEAFTVWLRQVTHIFNLSLSTATFPDAWKQALVIPIPKTGDLTKVQNYRPISLLPLPGKILEKLIHSQLSNHLESDSLLSNWQHGFRKAHSTMHSVVQLTNYINGKLDNGLPVLAVYIDFRKAFDCVQHPILIEKLKQIGLSSTAVSWVRSYLSNRKQRVLANDTYSDYLTIKQGVPQGSVLGPLFYIIYANDLCKVLKNCNMAMYADDTVLYTSNRSFMASVTKMQADINVLEQWCCKNGIMVNTDKTKMMVFGSSASLKSLPEFGVTFNQVPLQTVTSYKYLGVELDNKLNYDKHVQKLISQVSGKLKQFRRMRCFLNSTAAMLVYKNMLLPIIEYGDILLTACSFENKRRLQVLQNKGLRCALNKPRDDFTSTADLHDEAHILKLKYRRDEHILNIMFDLSRDPSYVKASRQGACTRSQQKKLLKTKRPKTEKFKKSLAYKGPTMWNNLSAFLHDLPSKNMFKVQIKGVIAGRAAGSSQLVG